MRYITASDNFEIKIIFDFREVEIIMDSLSRTIYHYDLKKGYEDELRFFCQTYKNLKEIYDKKYPHSKITNARTKMIIDKMTV